MLNSRRNYLCLLTMTTLYFGPTTAWMPMTSSGGVRNAVNTINNKQSTWLRATTTSSQQGQDEGGAASIAPTPAIIEGITLKVAFDENWGVAERANDVPSVRFTCEDSLDMVHRLRRDSDAVLVGRGTVQRDDCSLLVRRGVTVRNNKQPLRVILDPRLSLILAELHEGDRFQILEDDGNPTVIYHCVPDVDMTSLSLANNVQLVCMANTSTNTAVDSSSDRSTTDAEQIPKGGRPGRYFSPTAVRDHLRDKLNVRHLMVEGGPQTALNFLQEKLVDRAIIVKAPVRFEEPYPSGMTSQTLVDAGLELVGTKESGVDTIEHWSRPGLPWPENPTGIWP